MNKKEQKKLIVLIGVPASGKSTYYEKIKAEYPKHIHWSRDAIVERYAKHNNMTYSDAYYTYGKEVDDSFKTMSRMIRESKPNVVISDKTNLLSHGRDKSFISLKEMGYHITYVFFEMPKESQKQQWYDRVLSRKDKHIAVSILEDMYKNYVDYVPHGARVVPDEIIRINTWV